MKKHRHYMSVLVVVVLLGAVGACATDTAHEATPSRLIRLSTGPEGGGFFPLGEEIAASLRMRDLDVRTIVSTGGIANVRAIQGGEADLGLTFADIAYTAFSGQFGPDGR